MRIRILAATSLLLFAFGAQPASADAGSWVVTGHVGAIEVDRLVRGSGDWWAEVDKRKTSLGLGLSYDYSPILGVRVLYERANGLRSSNVCPPGATCPAIAIGEDTDFEAWQIAAVPRMPLGRDWSLFGTLGAMRWKLKEENLLPGDSGTEFVYGVGVNWRGVGDFELGLEYQRASTDYDAVRLNVGLRF